MGSERSAEELSRACDQYLGRSYEEMDCQEFVERCLQDIGIKIDLKGSNAWYRKCADEGWVGTPESCRRMTMFWIIWAVIALACFIAVMYISLPDKWRRK